MPKKHIFIIGPGGAGKTTSGELLASLLRFPFVDLDREFVARFGDIGSFIRSHGYERYCHSNSDLLYSLLEAAHTPSVLVLSSGFLVHEGLDALVEKHRFTLKEEGVSIVLLPSESPEESTEIVVRRQLARGFGLQEEREREKFNKRYELYKKEGDIRVFSKVSPMEIAQEMVSQLKTNNQA